MLCVEEIDGKIQVRQPQDGIDAVFDHKGDLIYSAMPKGFISIVSVSHRQIVDIIKVIIQFFSLPLRLQMPNRRFSTVRCKAMLQWGS